MVCASSPRVTVDAIVAPCDGSWKSYADRTRALRGVSGMATKSATQPFHATQIVVIRRTRRRRVLFFNGSYLCIRI